ncbi:LADA_0D01904g1_1 [Lachancea dasiensis]|uniref:LADA_0D01904g1_1 n=1 Tax=Lachancea dasiensis TaxID=1072105 RepID=A0A1G4J413_9SACH|nr:LADA_0D01904g1_1 [Lachancea dasiensis]
MTTSPVLEGDTQNQLKSFSEAILRHKSGNYPSLRASNDGHFFPSTNGATSNRGNKLLQKSDGVSRTTLRNLADSKEEQVFYNGSFHKLLARKRHHEDSDDEDSTVNLHNLVDLRQVLAPVSSLKDIAVHPAVSKTYKNEVLGELALQTVLMIEKEQKNVVALSKLLEAFLGDYPGALLEQNLRLKEYNHNLKLGEDAEDHSSTQPPLDIKPDGYPQDDEDPFFALPQFDPYSFLPSVVSQNLGQSTEEVEAGRQLTQIALQRNQEFIRNLQKIRNCIVKAQRIKERIHLWGREYAGIQEEDVTVPTALHAVKRGLISATTNRTVTEENIEPEVEDEEV